VSLPVSALPFLAALRLTTSRPMINMCICKGEISVPLNPSSHGFFRMEDFYEILAVSRQATTEEIKLSYRRLALKYHPDRNPGDKVAEDYFRRVSHAYQILSDAEKRQLYDLYGHPGLESLGLDADFEDLFSSFGEEFEDFFNFGRSRGPASQAQPGADLRHEVLLTLEDVVRGLETSLHVKRRVDCRRCRGRGLEPGSERQTCPTCGGRGQVSQTKGQLKIFNTCPRCQGAGTIVPSPCTACQGTGLIEEEKSLQVRIPPGVDAGTRLRLKGEGEAGQEGGKPGDLYIEVQLAPHPVFTRKERDLYYQARLSFVEAALGTEIEVPTLDAQTRLKIPAGTQPGALFRIQGKGLPGLRSKSRGDLVVVVDLKTPTSLSPQQRQLLREFLRLAEPGETEGVEGRSRVG
jgi:molecular chaperone DnaJ